MDKTHIILIIAAMLTAFGVYYSQQQPQEVQEMYQSKIEWENFKIRHSRNYDSIEEESYRFKVFKDNLEMIKKHNADSTKTYKMGMNHFGDLTEQEFSQKVLTPNLKNMKTNINLEVVESQSNLRSSPASVDWRGKGVVTAVKNQGMCGSCWAFSTAGALEGAVAMKNKTLNDYSEQQLVDCCSYSKYGCKGCSGSWPEWAMEYVRDTGIMLDKEYPYTGIQDKCKGTTTAVKILDHKKAWSQLSNNTETVKQTLATLGPLSISVDAYKWQFYISGIFNDCHDAEVDHSVLLVGYQEDGTWIVKNSWSDAWGEKGYIRIASKGSACLIKDHIIIPHLAA